ncbi:MAG TPA: efflux RND transporter permease subunit [Candidatus Methylomirabilis sp.]|jgi:multidrug efflux pump subunit AcrB|nr:efflux RND transporter permease subunit [Candidatus Methylomirabilis sp.]
MTTKAQGSPPPPTEPPSGFGGSLVRYYRLYILVVLAILAHGITSFILLPRTEDPEFDSTESRIITLYPGVEAREVETQVTRRLEDAIDELEGIRTIESTSYAGLSLIKIRISDDAVPTDVVKDIREKVRDSTKDLPQGVKEPIVIVLNTAFIPVSIVSLTGPPDYRLLEDWSETLRKTLALVEDVAAVQVEGLPERQLLVNVDNERLSQVRIPLTRMRDVLTLENAGIPAGKLDVGTRRYLLRTPNEFDTPESVGSTVIGAVGDSVIHLRDVAEVSEGFEDFRYIVRTDRKPAVLLTVRKKEKTNTIWVSERVREKVDEMRKILPPGMEVMTINDRGQSVAQLLGDLGSNAWSGGLLVICSVWFFLGLRQALVVSVSIPLSVLITFSIMYATSIDLHQMSIFGLVLALGLVVDASLVVVEAVEGKLEEGESLVSAVSKGVGEVAWPIASATFTTIAAFLPMLYLTGIIGDFLFSMPVAVVYSLLASLFVAVTVVPLLCYAMWKRWPESHHGKKDGGEDRQSRLLDFYTGIAKFSLRHKFLTLGPAVLAFIIALWAIPKLGIEYFPKADKKLFLIHVRLPTDANIDTTDGVVRQVEDLLGKEEQIRDFTANIGRGSPRVYYSEEPEDENPSYAQLVVNLKDSFEGSTDAYVDGLQERLRQVSGATVQTKVLQQGPQAGAAIQIRIAGDDLQVLADLARQVKDRIQDVPGVVDLRDTLGDRIPRLSMKFDREKAGRLGVDTLSFARTLLMALNGETASTFRGAKEEMPLVVRVKKGTFKEISDLTRLYVPSQTGAMVPFGEVAEVRQEQDFARIGRRDGRRSVIVQADVSGRLVIDAVRDVRERLQGPAQAKPSPGLVDRVKGLLGLGTPARAPARAGLSLPLGYDLTLGGESEERDEAFAALGRAMIVGFLLIYAILALEFNSFVQPIVIILTIPLGVVGSVLGLWVMGYPFGFMAFIGIVGQSGVVITDAIVLCDYANYLQREGGKGMYESLLLAGRRRMRPVILTSVTDVVGLIPPMIWGGSLWAPLSTAMAWGLGTSTILVLLILPCMYAVLVRPREGRRKLRLLSRLVGR